MLYYLHARHISRLILFGLSRWVRLRHVQRHVYELASPLPPARLAVHGSQRALERLGTQKQQQHITGEQSARLVAMRSNPVCPATQGNVVPNHEESAITMPQFWPGCTQDGPRISSSCERCERCDGAIHSYTFMHSACLDTLRKP